MTERFSEGRVVEDYIVKRLQEKGWGFVPADELQRESYQEPLLIPNLVRALKRVNKGFDIGDEEINKVLNELKLAGTGQRHPLSGYRMQKPHRSLRKLV